MHAYSASAWEAEAGGLHVLFFVLFVCIFETGSHYVTLTILEFIT